MRQTHLKSTASGRVEVWHSKESPNVIPVVHTVMIPFLSEVRGLLLKAAIQSVI
jgi:hypothetical protein